MKKIKVLLIAIIAVLALSTLKVGAIDNGTGSEPTSGIGYDIQGFSVDVYDTNALKNTQQGQGLKTLKSYPLSDIKINPEVRIDKMKGYELVSVKLNIEGGLESVKEKIKAELTKQKEQITGDANNKYLITFSVRYKLTTPESVIAVYDADYGNVFSGDQAVTKDETSTAQDPGLSQIIFSGIYDQSADTEDWTNGITYNYDNHTFTSRYNEMPLFDEYLLFTQQSPQIGLEKYRFMMHDIEDLDSNYFFKSAKDSDGETTAEKVDTPTKSAQVVKVPNTAAQDTAKLLFGSSILMIGSAIVLFQLSKKREN